LFSLVKFSLPCPFPNLAFRGPFFDGSPPPPHFIIFSPVPPFFFYTPSFPQCFVLEHPPPPLLSLSARLLISYTPPALPPVLCSRTFFCCPRRFPASTPLTTNVRQMTPPAFAQPHIFPPPFNLPLFFLRPAHPFFFPFARNNPPCGRKSPRFIAFPFPTDRPLWFFLSCTSSYVFYPPVQT